MYINVGSYVGDGTLVDSHALVGSCAQVGKNCHISAAAQIGGELSGANIEITVYLQRVAVDDLAGELRGHAERQVALPCAGRP